MDLSAAARDEFIHSKLTEYKGRALHDFEVGFRLAHEAALKRFQALFGAAPFIIPGL